ncbi:hypothetical protein V8G54_028619 [Vigna mungo]|uniref:Reverse transcriptase Ty1/copia-type domain-containing protein n=1 Tax=Vigna mungo TaxID=3915 RepID=A0AAQ3RIC0_VIGMU
MAFKFKDEMSRVATIQVHIGLKKKYVKCYKEASYISQWTQAKKDELKALENNNTWIMIDLPPMKIIGYTQLEGLDYLKTFTLIAKLTTLHLFLVVSTSNKWILKNLDLNNDFLHDDLHEEVYMKLPPSLTHEKPNQNSSVIHLSQCLDLLTEVGMLNYAPMPTLTMLLSRLTNQGDILNDEDASSYHRLVRRLIYFPNTIFEITFFINNLNQFVLSPTTLYQQAASHILRYLKATLDYENNVNIKSTTTLLSIGKPPLTIILSMLPASVKDAVSTSSCQPHLSILIFIEETINVLGHSASQSLGHLVSGFWPFGLTGSQSFSLTGIRPFGFAGARPFGLMSFRPFGLTTVRLYRYSTIRPHRHFPNEHLLTGIHPFGFADSRPFGLTNIQPFDLRYLVIRPYNTTRTTSLKLISPTYDIRDERLQRIANRTIAGTSPRSKLEDHRTVKGERERAVKIQGKQAIQSIQASESDKATSAKLAFRFTS